MTASGKIGAFTANELREKVRALEEKGRAADRAQASALLLEAQELIQLIHEELQRDQQALNTKRVEVMGQKAQVEAEFAETDRIREAAQAQAMQQLAAQLDASAQARKEQGFWARLTTSDKASKEIKGQIKATESVHDQEDMKDAQARQMAVSSVLAGAQVFEGEAAETHAVLAEAQQVVQFIMNRASGWGPGSEIFRRIEQMVGYGLRANANDLDARAFMAITGALTGNPIDTVNAWHQELKGLNQRLPHNYRCTDLEALATLACACGVAQIMPRQVLDLWCNAIDHARRAGGFSSDEDARSMVVFCTAVSRQPVEHVQCERRDINVQNFRGQDPEGSGLILLTHTLVGAPISHLVQVYHAAGYAGLPPEERGYMAMAAGLGQKSADFVVGRFRSLVQHVTNAVPLPPTFEARREAIREAAATLTIAAALSEWSDEQLVTLFNHTEEFRSYGPPDYEARGGLVIGAVAPGCKL